jgi:hypothetical protein
VSVFQTPWKLVGRSGNDFEQIKDADGNVLIEEIGFDLGMFIVKAVNANERMVEELNTARLALADYSRRTMWGTDGDEDVRKAQLAIVAALDKPAGVK